ncbi:DoxX family protein [Maritalea porphyrae]|jgi:putative oxidoreductase|uniref:DoxX family protein n=1 Tax=Maritalea porphyrae TaxID=880732 RepID=UPI0022AEE891|nr:DoxX family protein [Maritalea porphyrae]MCZ4271456.1 DoxX family protein [Maritalea porphyrae]
MDGLQKVAPLIARIFLAILFIMAGIGKLTGAEATAGYFGALGIPLPGVSVYLVGLFELVGGIAIVAGYQTRNVALAFAVFSIASAVLAHTNFADQTQMIMFMKNLGLAGGFLLLWVHGPGGMAVDKK